MDTFPGDLPGLAWSILRTPKFATRTQTSISGRKSTLADQAYPIWTWTLIYNFLRDGNDFGFKEAPSLGTGRQELRELMGFYLRQQGAFQIFLYNDTSDNQTLNQVIGTGDGSTTAFQLVRTMSAPPYGGLFTEPITQPGTILGVFVNAQTVHYTLGAYGVVNLSTPPADDAIVTASFTYFWPVRFADDSAEFENFMYGLWSLKKLSFESVLLP